MTPREQASHNPEGSKTVRNIRTARKNRKNKNVSWSASNKRHCFTRGGHLYDEGKRLDFEHLFLIIDKTFQ